MVSMLPSFSGKRKLLATTLVTALLWAVALWAFARLRPLSGQAPSTFQVQPQYAGLAGINLELSELTGSRLAAALADLEMGGIRWVRFTLPWDQIEPARGQFDWARWDAVFAELAKHPSLRPVVVLNGSPAWARAAADADNLQAPPHERADFGAFAAAVARRYGDRVRYYQVWHEPNIAPHWGAGPADPAGYLGLLREAAVQIRAADPDAQIVLAALAPTIEQGGPNQSDITYLDALYGLGARTWFDIAAAEPYGFSQPPDAPADPSVLNFGRAALLRQVMLAQGDGDTLLWATAFGWNTVEGSPWGSVSEADQARYAAQALGRARTDGSWLGPLFWAALCPERPAGDPWLGFAVFDSAVCGPGGQQSSVWGALATNGAPATVLSLGRHAADDPALRYSQGWRVTPSAADPSKDGDALDFAFSGAGLALRIQGGPYWAYYHITVDGEPANALPRDESGAAYLVLHDPSGETRWVTVARDLSPAVHLVHLAAIGGWGQWALQGLEVTAGAERPAWVAWALLALALLATVAWAALAWPYRRRVAGWLLAGLDAVAALPAAILWIAAALCVLLLVMSHLAAFDLAALAGLGLLFLVRPDLSLPLIAASLPFWQRPEHLLRWDLAHFEIFLWLGVAALAVRLLVARLVDVGQVNNLSDGPISSAVSHAGFDTTAHEKPSAWIRRFSRPGGRRKKPAEASSPERGAAIFRADGHAARDAPAEENLTAEAQRTQSISGFLRVLRVSAVIFRAADSVNRNLDWPVLALFLSGLLATISAQEQGVAWREFRTVFLGGALFYLLITRAPWPPGRRFSPAPLLSGFLAGMAAASLIGLWQLATGQGRVDVEGVWRVRALYGSPNNLALVLDRAVPLSLALAAFGSALGSGWGRRAVRWALWAATALMLAACIVTFSKGALLLGLPVGIGLALIAGAWRGKRRWPLWALGGLTVAAGVMLVILFRTPRFADLFNFGSGTSFVRIKLWRGALHMAVAHPLLGVGPDNFLYAYRTRYVLPGAWQELSLSHPHNIFLDLWTRLGLIGVLAGGWAVIAGWRRGWRLFRAGGAGVWPLALGLLGALAATVAHGLIDNSLFLVDLMGIFMVTLGVFRRIDE